MKFIAQLFIVAALCACSLTYAQQAPNIVFILADDLGYGGLNCYGTDWLETPNIDQLSRDGMKFTNGYASHPTCQPSRIAILSGQYSPRTGGYRVMNHHRGQEDKIKYIVPQLTGLALEKTTFADTFKQAGYATAMYGKWHADNYDKALHPSGQGFDVAIVANDHYGKKPSRPKVDLPEGMDYAELFTGMAIEFMAEAKANDQPFFLYMPYYLVHAPFETRADYIEHFQAKLAGKVFKDKKADNIPIIAAMTKHLDDQVGRLVAALQEMGLEDNTIVVFTSDNGSYCKDLVGGYRGTKGDVYDGGMRVPYLFKWPNKIAAGSLSEERITHVDLFPTFLDMAGLPRPENHPLDGVDLTPLLTGKVEHIAPRPIVCYYPKYAGFSDKTKTWRVPWRNVLFDGDYKLRENVEYSSYELYNLKNDPLESKDLAPSHPEKVQQLEQKLRAWEQQVGAPELTPNPDYSLN
ncbi:MULTISPECIES: sulfatase [unclassified Lentimonas]|uniref:sulfatase n=1 Tax=unclassified Lentimonas TaxID=2630993 RepID=UPI0013234557|nr:MULTISPECIES: sulfatase [unclassified Lentimonas]CAA6678654.1 Choline-sulfatase (EC [Lentimonas sp. CC4]CAA6683640.1 Choline-sulfatase (EC [Lentimonas sp. CC6]CAA7074514.1 Choline-sulfatase (EC [Lentimonas sp. CC4]CAA7169126.1 Choline-sulfatase (EC [Lentimonas sp. CC21]CAA7180469.1 Choline-sulfatase (EC [Lentimonas sp. CC8]